MAILLEISREIYGQHVVLTTKLGGAILLLCFVIQPQQQPKDLTQAKKY